MKLLTVDQVAEQLGLDPQTVRAQLRTGALAGEKYGRDWLVAPAEVARYRADRLGRPGRRSATVA